MFNFESLFRKIEKNFEKGYEISYSELDIKNKDTPNSLQELNKEGFFLIGRHLIFRWALRNSKPKWLRK